MSKQEAKIYTITKNSCELLGGFIHKIQDVPFSSDFRFSIKKPFDQFFVFKGVCWFIEFKYISKFSAFSLKNLKEHQIEALEKIHNNRAGNIKPVVGLFVYFPRVIKRVYFFDYAFLKNNPFKKAALLRESKFFDIKKDMFDFSKISYNLID